MSASGSDENGTRETTGSEASEGALENCGSENRAVERRKTSLERSRTVLERVRTEPGLHAVAVAGAVVLGLLASWLHWFGLVLGGAFVAFVSPSLRRGIVGAVGFGLVVLVVFALTLGGSAWTVLEMTPVVYLVIASAFGLPVLGSLLRGLL
ncbi:hypothetical protein [Natronorubrum texcoconense]|uniref:Uncharacterized protein n=1 Tax=Natronorubrum texcoconense TaxID=1095776 RepID=A0A1G9AC14_9EURY|nr:hypothetical protein [Natronorubrum texcoconense]SDK24899.1 hypothetical protein SAMN04515672_2668 [Natronorubrum texcoconense]